MKFAIISDIHGNLSALEAVIKDADSNLVDAFIFAGDYFLSNPFPNECMDRIRTIDNKYIIRGNEEGYLENLNGKDQSTWTDGQMQISYYCYRAVSEDNLKYILSVPTKLKINSHGIDINIAHSSSEFIGDCEHKEWSTAKLAAKVKAQIITVESLHNDIHDYIENDEKNYQTSVY